MEKGEVIKRINGHNGEISRIIIDPNKRYLITAGWEDKLIKIWDLKDFNLLQTIKAVPDGFEPTSSFLNTITLDPQGKYIFSGGSDFTINIWSLETGAHIRKIPWPENGTPKNYMNSGIQSIAVDPSDQFLVAGSVWGSIKKWKITTGELIQTISGISYEMISNNPEESSFPSSLSSRAENVVDKLSLYYVDPDLKFAAVKNDQNDVNVWNLQSLEMIKNIKAKDGALCCEFDPEGKIFAVGYASDEIRVFDTYSGTLINILQNPIENRRIKWVKFASGENILISMHGERSLFSDAKANVLNLWNVKTGELIQTIEGCDKIRIDPSGKYLAGLSGNKTLRIWELKTGELQREFAIEKERKHVNVVDFIRNGEIVVIGIDGDLYFWNIKSGRMLEKPEVGANINKSIETDPSGRFVIYASRERRFGYGELNRNFYIISNEGLVDFRMLTRESRFPHHYFYSGERVKKLSPESVQSVTVWDIDKGEIILRINDHSNKIECFEIDPTGRFAVSVSSGEIHIWDLNARTRLRSFHEKNYCFTLAAVDPSGNYVAVASCRGLYIWNIKTSERVNIISDITNIKRIQIIDDNALSDQPIILTQTDDDILLITELLSGRHLDFGGFGEKQRISPVIVKGKYIISDTMYNGITLWNVLAGEKLSLLSSGEDWIISNSKGYFNSSREGSNLVSMVKGLDVYGIDQFAFKNNRPDILLKTMDLGDENLIDHFYHQFIKRLRRSGLSEKDLSANLHIPVAEILKSKTDDKYIEIDFKLSDSRYNLKSYNIFVNNIPMYGIKGKKIKGNEVKIIEKMELSTGRNNIEIACMNVKGAESFRTLVSADYEAPVKGNLYFIGFGVSKYRDGYLNLKYAAKDIKDLESTFLKMQTGYDRIYCRIFTNNDVTISNINKIKKLLSRSTIDDMFVLFMAGHVLHDRDKESAYYYLVHDTDINDLSGSAVSFDVIEEILLGIKARKKLLLIDTCKLDISKSYIADNFFAKISSWGLIPRIPRVNLDILRSPKFSGSQAYLINQDQCIYNDLFRKSGVILFSSSRDDEFTYESDSLENSFFTESIIKSLSTNDADQNHDNILTFVEMRNYVTQSVVKMTHDLQHPTMDIDNIDQEIQFPLVH